MRNPEHLVVLHVVGPDRPGITSTLTGILAREGGTLVDIGQSVLHEWLSLSAIVEVPPGSDALREVLFAGARLGLRVEVNAISPDVAAREGEAPTALSVTLLGDLEDVAAVAATTAFLATRRLNIRDIKTLSRGGLRGLELLADLPPDTGGDDESLAELRGEILQLGADLDVDMAVQREGVFRRNKRLVCMDVDSTFIRNEVIDELADLAGCRERVASLTARAMAGEMDFATALRERIRCLAGFPFERAMAVLERLDPSPGAEDLVRRLRLLGLRIGLVSGGFTFVVDRLKQRYGLDFGFANQLEVRDGVLTGNVVGAIVDAERKAQVVRDMAQVWQCRLEQCVAVGDGANDLGMLRTAGLGIAFRGKPKVQQAAHLSLNRASLDSILYLMGFHERDLAVL